MREKLIKYNIKSAVFSTVSFISCTVYCIIHAMHLFPVIVVTWCRQKNVQGNMAAKFKSTVNNGLLQQGIDTSFI